MRASKHKETGRSKALWRRRQRHLVLAALCLLTFFSVGGVSPERSPDTRSLQAAPAARSSNIALTVAVVSEGVTVRLYDEFGSLFERTTVLTPPAMAALRTPEGSSIELNVPGGVFSGSAIIDIYMKGRPAVRPLIEEADRRAAEESAIPFGDMGPVEFTSTTDPRGTVTISLSYPLGSNPALLNSLRAYCLPDDNPTWVAVTGSRLDPEKRMVTFEVSRFEVIRLMTGSSHDLAGMIVYPNPFRPRLAKDNVLKFIGLTENVDITIYTLSGDVVWSKHIRFTGGGATWDGRNQEGREVASGLYVYQITNADGQKARGRISIIW
jgi:hypothetical protein